jgi:hypothetical protein
MLALVAQHEREIQRGDLQGQRQAETLEIAAAAMPATPGATVADHARARRSPGPGVDIHDLDHQPVTD